MVAALRGLSKRVVSQDGEAQAVLRFEAGDGESVSDARVERRLALAGILEGDEFVERFARPNLSAILELLDEGRRDGSLRDVDPRFAVPSMLGSCVFFFLSSPILTRLYDIEEIDAEITQEFAENTADLILHGISTRPATSS